MNTKKLRNEPQVHLDFPYPEFANKEAWLKKVKKQWTAFVKAFEETQVGIGAGYYPLEVGRWIAAFNCDEVNMKNLMDDYCNGTSDEPVGEMVLPLSIVKELVKEELAKKL